MVEKITSSLEDPNGNYINIVPACINENNNTQLTINKFGTQLDQ